MRTSRALRNVATSVVEERAKPAGQPHLPTHGLIKAHGALHVIWIVRAPAQGERLPVGIGDRDFVYDVAIHDTTLRRPGRCRHPLAMHAKLEIAAVCHAYGAITSHNAGTEIRDLSGAADDALAASQTLGYGRMWSIHPDQIVPIVKAFAPAADETEDATAILLAARSAGWGPIQYKAKLHDRASCRYDWAVLRRTKQSGQPLPETAGALM